MKLYQRTALVLDTSMVFTAYNSTPQYRSTGDNVHTTSINSINKFSEEFLIILHWQKIQFFHDTDLDGKWWESLSAPPFNGACQHLYG